MAQAELKVEAVYGSGANVYKLATGSPGELGLLQALGEAFGKKENAKMEWIKAGSGASLNLLKTKQVDMIMVHAPEAVNKALAEGWATDRTLIGSNEFYIVGPKSDPAREIKRLLAEKPKVLGLAVPAMPLGSPGMDGPEYKGKKDPYDVLLIGLNGEPSIYQSYR